MLVYPLYFFDNKFIPQIEENNALVLGDWPKKVALLFNMGKGIWKSLYLGRFYKKTSELHQNIFNQARSLFSIEKEDKFGEKKFVKPIFKSLNGANWLRDSYRLNNIEFIRDSFILLVMESNLFSKEKNLNYIDVVMNGRTSVKNYEKYKVIQAVYSKSNLFKNKL